MGPFLTLRGRNLYLLMKIICGTSFMMYGYDAGVLGGVLLHPAFLNAIGNPQGTYIIPMISSSYSLAACVTALIASTFAFRVGRRGTILIGNIAAIIGSLIQASSYSVAQLIVGRICTGFAIGCISSAVPTYLAETGVETGDRGPANAFNAAMLISGVPLAYWIDFGFTKMQNQASWRVPIVFQCLFAGVGGGTMYFLPGVKTLKSNELTYVARNTPRWYFARNRPEEGERILAQLYDADTSDARVQETKREIMLAIDAELEANSSLHWKQFVTMGIVDKTPMKIIRRLCICFWLPMIREWMGSSLIAYYSSVILATVAKPSLVSLLSGVLNIFFALGCVPLYFTIERVGRRSVLMYGAMTMTVLLTIFTILVAIPLTASIQWASIGIIFVFLFVFGYAWQGCVWLYCAEIAPLEYRHVGAAATAFGEWLMTFITVFAGPIGLTDIGWYFWLWVISGNVVAVIFVYLLCPETGGKTLEQVDFLFTKGALAHLKVGQALGDEEEQWNGGEKTRTDHIEIRKIAQ